MTVDEIYLLLIRVRGGAPASSFFYGVGAQNDRSFGTVAFWMIRHKKATQTVAFLM